MKRFKVWSVEEKRYLQWHDCYYLDDEGNLWNIYYNGKLHKQTYYAKDFKDGKAMEPVGYCEAFDIMKNDLIKILEELQRSTR